MKQLKSYQPLCILQNKVLLYKKGKLVLYDEGHDSYQLIMNISSNLTKKIKGNSRILSRVFRIGIRNALLLSNDELLLTFDRGLYYISLSKKQTKELFHVKLGFSAPLNLCASLEKTKFIALFGDYGNNKDRQPVSIYGVDKNLAVQEIYTFSANKIRHIHNIIPDKYNNGYYIFTGDNEVEAGIYWTDKEFSIMKPIFIGDQNARAVCGFMTEDGLLYATDSILQKNYIFLLNVHKEHPLLEEITSINGPCIYATRYSLGYVFSTTVESDESNGNRILSLLSMKRGAGIQSDDVHLVYVSSQLKSKIIGIFKKDKLPYKLFQYGSVRFPSGLENHESLIIYPNAVEEFDGSTVFINI